MKRLILILVIALVGNNLFAQTGPEGSLNQLRDIVRSNSTITGLSYEKDANNYEGTPFLYDDWKASTLMLSDGQSVDLFLKYFVYGNEIWGKETLEKEPKILNLSANRVNKFSIGEKEFKPITYDGKGKKEFAYMEVLTEGKISLLKLYECNLQQAQNVSTYQQKQKDKFVTKEKYFYQFEDNTVRLLPTKKKELFSVFGSKSKEMEKYFNENKMKVNEEDLLKLVSYYNSNV